LKGDPRPTSRATKQILAAMRIFEKQIIDINEHFQLCKTNHLRDWRYKKENVLKVWYSSNSLI
jgi:hypothetical protein